MQEPTPFPEPLRSAETLPEEKPLIDRLKESALERHRAQDNYVDKVGGRVTGYGILIAVYDTLDENIHTAEESQNTFETIRKQAGLRLEEIDLESMEDAKTWDAFYKKGSAHILSDLLHKEHPELWDIDDERQREAEFKLGG